MDLYYGTQGSGPAVVMIHSPGVDSREWKGLAPLLAKSNQVVTYDGRGMGESPAPQEPMDPVSDLLGLLQHLQLNRVTLIGHSMGGELALNFALAHPDMVERLIVIAPSLTGYPYSQAFLEWMGAVNALAPDIGKMVEFSLEGPNYRTVMASEHRDFLIDLHSHYMTRVFTEWRSFEVIWPQPPAIERLEQVAAPTLFIHGTVEWGDMLGVAKEFERVPSVQFDKVEGADHMITMTHASKLASIIQRFLDSNREE
ncbi:alpha/beta fold hydrolase [Paenibacillus spongiae]|uniref:Alpha/beta hydrolase n=1 Tax=Paenibacillus spongiae TaxID=2909671 RepID=A0ABY5SEY8_9BACL|nr:alpha/beta hydrolase [Paenibacillus spongiae]UVI31065.1 alpha/beta hydrolase [Paenibacillus spongiae]